MESQPPTVTEAHSDLPSLASRISEKLRDIADVVDPEAPVERAVATATALGHTVEWDPPSGMTAARRWTCATCGAAVLDYQGNIYGSATTDACEVSR